ncbi:MAG TPA: hypothetical protein VFC45_14220, partial [Pseudolabrys sp.]|nr:hypothetical protein [Pseudolabrys sp.]
MNKRISRRDILKSGAALGAITLFAQPLKAAAPAPAAVTPALIEAARKEAKVSFYTAIELNTAQRLANAFEAKYPGIAVRIERSGAERVYQRIAQEQSSNIHAVDVVSSTDTSHFLDWTAKNWVEPYLTDGVIGRPAFRSLEILGAALQADGGTRSAFAASSIRRRSVSHGPLCR